MTHNLEPRVVEMAKALVREIDGIEPDVMVYRGEPYRVRQGFVIPGVASPAWERYIAIASDLYEIAQGFEP